MKIETFFIGWNRENTIHLTIKHYQKLGKVTYYDNFSDDRTRDIAESLGADVRLFGTAGVLDDDVYTDIKNHCWKNSKADWVIVVDDDEILLLPEKMEGTILKPRGFSIFSNDIPKEDWMEITTGIDDPNYSKLCCFRPDQIKDIKYIWGCHQANPVGNVEIFEAGTLLHYRSAGGADRLIKLHQTYEPRRQRSPKNMRYGLGGHYKETVDDPEKTRKWFNENLAASKPFRDA